MMLWLAILIIGVYKRDMMEYLKDLLNRLISDKQPERVSALLALVSGLSLSIAFLTLIIATICQGNVYLSLITLILAAVVALANFNKK